jgi:prepilin-type N-terminal cleavage/methylation domain-containing protein
VAIRPPKYNSQGFTLIEMIVTLGIAGIILGFAAPSLLSWNKPLRDGSLQFRSHLSLIRSKAISSNQSYRIRPKYPTTAQYKGQKYQQTPHNFIVEYAANCQVNTYGTGLAKTAASATVERPYNATYPEGKPDGWMTASQFDLDLPDQIGVVSSPMTQVNGAAVTATSQSFQPANQTALTTVTFEPYLNWSICYDNRGVAFQPVDLTLQDFQGNNRAASALIQVIGVGNTDITTKDKNGGVIPPNGDSPVF